MDIREDRTVFTVSEIVTQAKEVVEQTFHHVWIEGELSNLTKHTSGHWYFTLKDNNSQLRAAAFRGVNRLIRFDVEDGLKVRALGCLSIYPGRGDFQLVVETMEPAGLGSLQLAYEQLKNRLYQEGLFDEAGKQPLPMYPKKIAVVTSPTGAAIRDILNVIGRRSPITAVDIYPVAVQGKGAAEEIAHAIRRLNEAGRWDVIICGRGGGSLEDLWAFNEEVVARAIAASTIPVISAVGHEIDYTIADLAADARAETPTAAAELVARDSRALRDDLRYLNKELYQRMHRLLEGYGNRLAQLKTSPVLAAPRRVLEPLMQKTDDLKSRLLRVNRQYLNSIQDQLKYKLAQLDALSPLKVLGRGYALVYKAPGQELVKAGAQVKLNDELRIKLAQGNIKARVSELE